MRAEVTRLLIIEANPACAVAIRNKLSEYDAGRTVVQQAETLVAGLDCLARDRFDAVLLDLDLPDSNGLATVYRIKEQTAATPIIVATATESLEMAERALRAGAADYLHKGELASGVLSRAIRYAIMRNEWTQLHLADQLRYQQLLAAITSHVYSVQIRDGQPCATRHGLGCVATTGYSPDDYAADPYLWFRMIHADDRENIQHHVARVLSGERVLPVEHRIVRRDGTIHWIRNTMIPQFDAGGRLVGYDGLVEDVTELRMAEDAVRQNEARLLAAKKVQEGLMHPAAPTLPGYDIAGGFVPCEMLGGDFFDFIPMLDKSLGIVVGDSSGHSLAAALITAELRSTLRALVQTYRGVGEILTLANRILSSAMPESYFATLLFARLEPAARTLVYSTAGHPPPCLFDAAGKPRMKLQTMGLPLGVEADQAYDSSGAILLKPGDTVFFFSDGVFEAAPPDGDGLGMKRLVEILPALLSHAACEIVVALHQRIAAHCRGHLSDDITTVVLKVTPEADEVAA